MRKQESVYLQLFVSWVRYTNATEQIADAWFGRGLLLGTIFYQQCLEKILSTHNQEQVLR